MVNDQTLALELPVPMWAEVIGALYGTAWSEPQREQLGRLAGLLYAQYIRAHGLDPSTVAKLSMLPDRLRQLVTEDV